MKLIVIIESFQLNLGRVYLLLSIFGVLLLASGCQQNTAVSIQPAEKTVAVSPMPITKTATSFPAQFTPTLQPATPYATQEPIKVKLAACDCLPGRIMQELKIPEGVEFEEERSSADYYLTILPEADSGDALILAEWIFVLVAPFPTLADGIKSEELKQFWQTETANNTDRFSVLMMSPETSLILEHWWGESGNRQVIRVDEKEILQSAWRDKNTWAIIPFDELDPRWKVLRIDDLSPLDSTFVSSEYSLRLPVGLEILSGDVTKQAAHIAERLHIPGSNLDRENLTSLIMTGTTALVRYTALRMEEKGVHYPAGDIVDLLQDADFTHISNEVPFYTECPPAQPVRLEQRFCSDPAYFDLIKHIDADLIELTGNHILDWGAAPFIFTLELYDQFGIPYYGGGRNLHDARMPLTLEKKEEKLTFLGCSPAGPEVVWATESQPGSNPCDWEWLSQEVENANRNDAIPIVTFQHLEVEDYIPHSSQRIDFLRAAELGAVIVSGSQAHFAQSMTFVEDRFIHFGLGNLFFDQMYGENPREFVDKHYFYEGRYISTELLTFMLEDSARPRPMTQEERLDFLEKIFSYCNWDTAFRENEE